MKFKKKKRIIISNNKINSIGVILLHNTYKSNSNRKIKLNKTAIYYKKNYIELFNKSNIEDIINSLDIKNNIENTINIYNNKLYIIVLKNSLPQYNKLSFLDMFRPTTKSIYNDIYNYNTKTKNNYLSNIITDKYEHYSIRLIDVYYYLIGYV